MKIFHHNDADGRLSAFLVARFFRDSLSKEDLIEVDYTTPISVDNIKKDELVFIVDFSFSGKRFGDLEEIINRAAHVVWIDHHADFLKMEETDPWTAEIPGIRRQNIMSTGEKRIKFSGAALTMIYMDMIDHVIGTTCTFIPSLETTEQRVLNLIDVRALRKNKEFTDEEFTFDTYHTISESLMEMVEYVSDYDTFSRCYPNFEEFYYGIERINQNPWGDGWLTPVRNVIAIGSSIKSTMDSYNEEYLNRNGVIYAVRLTNTKYPDLVRILAVNRDGNSFIFNSVPDIENNFPVRMIFRMVDAQHMKVTFFSDEGKRDYALELASQFRGGGHPQAAGCTIPISKWDDIFSCIGTYKEWLEEYKSGVLEDNLIPIFPTKASKKAADLTNIWEIWMEGFNIQGENGEATKLGIGIGKTFGDAVKNLRDKLDDDNIKFNNDGTISYRGCYLFDNEADARATFG